MVENANKNTTEEENEQRKSSTINSMYIGTSISKPNVESIINAVATILHSQMLEVSHYSHFNFRIKVKEEQFLKILTCSFSRKKSTFLKNLTHSTNKESLY